MTVLNPTVIFGVPVNPLASVAVSALPVTLPVKAPTKVGAVVTPANTASPLE